MQHARARAGLAIAATCIGLWLSSRIVPYQVDDAFITYRFAANLLAGEGIVYNPGGETVEGFSSPAWLGLTALAGSALGSDAIPHASLALGVASLLLLLTLVYRGGGALSVAVIACSPTVIFYSVTGLETCAFAACVAAYSASLAGRLPRWAGYVASALASFIRPEGPFVVVAGLVQLVCAEAGGCAREQGSEPAARRDRARFWFRTALSGALAFFTLIALRWCLFGELLPNTYYAKPAQLSAGLPYVFKALSQPWMLATVLAAALLVLRGNPTSRGYFAAALCWCGAAALEGGDWMPQARMLLPALVLFALALGEGIASPVIRTSDLLRFAAVATAMVCGVTAALAQGETSQRSLASIRREARLLSARIGRSGAASIAAIDIGELGFSQRIEIVDLAGLTDTRIAHSEGPHMNKLIDLSYVFAERRPDLLMIRLRDLEIQPKNSDVRLPAQQAMSLIEARLLLDPRLRSEYQLALVQFPRVPRSATYARALFRRRDFVARRESRLDGPLLLMPTGP